MSTKNKPGTFDCYANAHPDEPMFVLLGRDPMAAALVRLWADMREARGEDPAKVAESVACAGAMEAWTRSLGKEPDTFQVTRCRAVEPERSGREMVTRKNVVTYAASYIQGRKIELCEEHATNEHAGFSLGRVEHGAHWGVCEVCLALGQVPRGGLSSGRARA